MNLGLQGNQGDPTWWVSGCLSKDADPEMLTGFRGSMWTSQVFGRTLTPCHLTARSPVSSSGPPGRPSWASLLACPAPGVSTLVPCSRLPHSPDSSPSPLLSQIVLCDKAESPHPELIHPGTHSRYGYMLKNSGLSVTKNTICVSEQTGLFSQASWFGESGHTLE